MTEQLLKRKRSEEFVLSKNKKIKISKMKKKLYGRCHTDGCGKYASYGKEGTKTPTHCTQCCKNLEGYVDLKHKKCPCGKTASWGKEGTKTRTHCTQCCKNLEGYVDLKNKKCPCGIAMNNCTKCNPLEVLLKRKTRCNGCGCQINGTTRTEYCATCKPKAKKREEYLVWDMIKARLPEPDISPYNKKPIAGITQQDKKVCSVDHKRYPDVMWSRLDRIMHLEIDEDSHSDRETSCELAKVDESKFGAKGGLLPSITLRFNPSAFDGGRFSLEYKADRLVEQLKFHMTNPIENYQPYQPNVEFLFYHSKSQKHIDAAKKSLNVVGVITK